MLAVLVALAGMAHGGRAVRLPREVCTRILRVLRPSESALRRLIVVQMEQMRAKPRGAVARAHRPVPLNISRGGGASIPSFALFDTRPVLTIDGVRRVKRGNPRLWSPGMEYPVFVTKSVPMPDDLLSAASITRRILAMRHALDDLPKQARRMARWQAKREAARAESGKYIRPMRPGRPPGHRARKRHPVDFILSDCHELALYLLETAAHPPEP